MTEAEAAALLRSPPKRIKQRIKPGKKVPIKALIEQEKVNATGLRTPLQGLKMVLALPQVEESVVLRLPEEQQGALCCAISRHDNSQADEVLPTPSADITHARDGEESPWHTAKLEFTLFDEWMQSPESQDLPQEIREALQKRRHVFPDSPPRGLPPKRPHNHHILLAPGKLPAKSAIYLAPDFPLLPVQTILEMLGGAKYLSTLDLEAGFHQIRMAKEERWKTALRSVLGLFEYKVMSFDLKGAPATFQANINAYFQPLRGHGVIADLDDVLTYSVDLPTQVLLLRKEGIKSAADKVEAIRAWPEVQANEAQLRQFLGTVNYCRMFMGPDYADISRPLVTLTRKATPFYCAAAHTQTVRHLKQRLIEYTTLQAPDISKPFDFYTDASGYAIGGIVELARQPIGFLSQAMTPVQQKYSIYDQELLALVTALDKFSHVLRIKLLPTYESSRRPTPCEDPPPGADALSRLPCHSSPPPPPLLSSLLPPPSGSVAPLVLAPADPNSAYHTRGKQVNYRQLAGNESSYGTEPSTVLPVQPADSATLDWPAAYAQCPVFRAPHNTAVQALMAHMCSAVSRIPYTLYMAYFVAVKTFTAADTVDMLAGRLIRYHGFPEALISDRDPRFQSALWQQLCECFHIKRAMSSSTILRVTARGHA
ncbi:OSJNBa0042F21.10 protein, related [Eimeria brunetti]|uniref:OSJNBa0042F21.10 protein, related n=1 Tax=Eimeria brunetti TaxID=51314 RepID=U6LZ24_9EIME|nr:OSJNBa0042F21.10 protein, related [Eimeria brunetti]